MNMIKAKMSSIKEKEQLPNVIALFPLPIYKTNIKREFTKEEQDELDVIISEQLTIMGAGDPTGLSTTKKLSIDKYLLKRKSFLSIQSFIEHHLKIFVENILGIDTDKTAWSPYITQSWLNVYKSKDYEPPHRHINCIISGVFYFNCLEVSDKPDGIKFTSPTHHMFEEFNLPTVQNTIFSDRPYLVSAVKGDLILFPSTTLHSVNLNETSDQTRISLAFNSI